MGVADLPAIAFDRVWVQVRMRIFVWQRKCGKRGRVPPAVAPPPVTSTLRRAASRRVRLRRPPMPAAVPSCGLERRSLRRPARPPRRRPPHSPPRNNDADTKQNQNKTTVQAGLRALAARRRLHRAGGLQRRQPVGQHRARDVCGGAARRAAACAHAAQAPQEPRRLTPLSSPPRTRTSKPCSQLRQQLGEPDVHYVMAIGRLMPSTRGDGGGPHEVRAHKARVLPDGAERREIWEEELLALQAHCYGGGGGGEGGGGEGGGAAGAMSD